MQMQFLVYEGMLEESALNRLGAVIKAAQIFCGGEVGAALIEDEDDSDLLHSRLRQALGLVAVGRVEGCSAWARTRPSRTGGMASRLPTARSPRPNAGWGQTLSGRAARDGLDQPAT